MYGLDKELLAIVFFLFYKYYEVGRLISFLKRFRDFCQNVEETLNRLIFYPTASFLKIFFVGD